MTRLNPVRRFFLLGALLALSACGTGAQYGHMAGPAAPAQSPPSALDAQSAQGGLLPPPVGQAPQSPRPQPDLPAVKVGILLPLSGQHGALGQAMLQAAQMALFDVGHGSFELLPRDTAQGGAQAAAQSAISEGAQLLLGPVFADDVRAVAPAARSAGVNVIAFSTDWTLAGDNVFLMGFMPFDQVERVTAFAAAHNLRRVGVIAPNTDYGRAVSGAFQTAAPRYGISVPQTASIPAGGDVAAIVKNFAAASPASLPAFDGVLIPADGTLAGSVSGQLTASGLPPMTVRRLGTGLLDNTAVSQPGLEGAWFAAPSPRLRASFENRFLKTYTYPAPRLSTLSYDATALAAILAQRGLQTGGRPAFDRASVTNPNGFFGIDGIFRFRPGGTAERGLAILELRNGKPVIIDDAPQTFQKPASF